MANSEVLPRRVDLPGSGDNLDLTTMGGRIAWARLREDMTQKKLGELTDKSRATIVQYEQGNIEPPINVVQRLAESLNVSASFLAFGEHGVEGIANAAAEMVTIAEVSFGRDGEYISSQFALPRKLVASYGVEPRHIKAFVLNHEALQFNLKSGDRIFADTSINAPDSKNDMYLLRTEAGMEIVQLMTSITVRSPTKDLNFIGPKGNPLVAKLEDLDIIGAVVGTLSKKD